MAKIPSIRATRADRGHDCTCLHRYFNFLEVYIHVVSRVNEAHLRALLRLTFAAEDPALFANPDEFPASCGHPAALRCVNRCSSEQGSYSLKTPSVLRSPKRALFTLTPAASPARALLLRFLRALGATPVLPREDPGEEKARSWRRTSKRSATRPSRTAGSWKRWNTLRKRSPSDRPATRSSPIGRGRSPPSAALMLHSQTPRRPLLSHRSGPRVTRARAPRCTA
jgi:hypothetical protein